MVKYWHFDKGLALHLASFLHPIFQPKNALKSPKLKENGILGYFYLF